MVCENYMKFNFQHPLIKFSWDTFDMLTYVSKDHVVYKVWPLPKNLQTMQ